MTQSTDWNPKQLFMTILVAAGALILFVFFFNIHGMSLTVHKGDGWGMSIEVDQLCAIVSPLLTAAFFVSWKFKPMHVICSITVNCGCRVTRHPWLQSQQ